MTCPDWRALVAARDAEPAADLPAWAAARRHAAQCSLCRGEALAADPLLLFSRLPKPAPAAADEIADMQAAVASLVRASRVAQSDPVTRGRNGAVAASPGTRTVTRFAAALGVCSLLALSGAPRTHPPGLGTLAAAGSLLAGAEAVVDEERAMQSVVEELDRPGARIYELPQAGMAVVMIVDASLDV